MKKKLNKKTLKHLKSCCSQIIPSRPFQSGFVQAAFFTFVLSNVCLCDAQTGFWYLFGPTTKVRSTPVFVKGLFVCLHVAFCASGFHCAAVTWADGAVSYHRWLSRSVLLPPFPRPTHFSHPLGNLHSCRSSENPRTVESSQLMSPIIRLRCRNTQMAFGMISTTIFGVFMDLATCPWMHTFILVFSGDPQLIECAFPCASSILMCWSVSRRECSHRKAFECICLCGSDHLRPQLVPITLKGQRDHF